MHGKGTQLRGSEVRGPISTQMPWSRATSISVSGAALFATSQEGVEWTDTRGPRPNHNASPAPGLVAVPASEDQRPPFASEGYSRNERETVHTLCLHSVFSGFFLDVFSYRAAW